jgi:hypothetical protein
VRAYKRAMQDHDYTRSREHTGALRAAGITILQAPEPQGNEVVYAPAWAVLLVTSLRQTAKEERQRLRNAYVRAKIVAHPHFTPHPPAALLERIDTLRAFAALRGWRYQAGMWHREQ